MSLFFFVFGLMFFLILENIILPALSFPGCSIPLHPVKSALIWGDFLMLSCLIRGTMLVVCFHLEHLSIKLPLSLRYLQDLFACSYSVYIFYSIIRFFFLILLCHVSTIFVTSGYSQ